jgi:hypothetical protein
MLLSGASQQKQKNEKHEKYTNDSLDCNERKFEYCNSQNAS